MQIEVSVALKCAISNHWKNNITVAYDQPLFKLQMPSSDVGRTSMQREATAESEVSDSPLNQNTLDVCCCSSSALLKTYVQ